MKTGIISENRPAADTFTPGELAQIEAFSKKTDLLDIRQTSVYGAGAAKHLEEVSRQILEHSSKQGPGSAADSVNRLLAGLAGDKSRKRAFFSLFFGKKKDKDNRMAGLTDETVSLLESHQDQLIRDMAVLRKLAEANKKSIKELSMYIAAGSMTLERTSARLSAMMSGAAETGCGQDSLMINDLKAACDNFEKKLYDLELSRALGQQNAVQIQIMQSDAAMLSDRIQTALSVTIPLWEKSRESREL